MTTREVEPTAREYEALVALDNAVWTDDRETVVGRRYRKENRETKYPAQPITVQDYEIRVPGHPTFVPAGLELAGAFYPESESNSGGNHVRTEHQ